MWKEPTANVNLLAANLTTQVRAIADVATAVTKGDLTRYIQVDAKGEVADLKNYLNAMIGTFAKTTDRNTTRLAQDQSREVHRMLQGQRDLTAVAQMLLSEFAPLVSAHQGVAYVMADTERGPRLKQLAAYADRRAPTIRAIRVERGLIGQCAYERRRLVLSDLPPRSLRGPRRG